LGDAEVGGRVVDGLVGKTAGWLVGRIAAVPDGPRGDGGRVIGAGSPMSW
jgi:hypothetical protein